SLIDAGLTAADEGLDAGLSTATGGDVRGAGPTIGGGDGRRNDLSGAQRQGAFVAVVVAGDDQVDLVPVEQTGPGLSHATVARVRRAGAVRGGMERGDDEIDPRSRPTVGGQGLLQPRRLGAGRPITIGADLVG